MTKKDPFSHRDFLTSLYYSLFSLAYSVFLEANSSYL